MEDKQLRVLMIEDSADDAFLIIRALKKGGYHPVYERVETASGIQKALQEKQWNIVLCDYNLPELNAPAAIALFRQANIDIPLLVVTGAVGEETATECMRLGAKDYIMKTNLSRLCPAIARELEDAENREKQRQAEEKLQSREAQFESIVTTSQEWIWSIDRLGVHTFSNAAIENMLGFTAEEIVKLGAVKDMVFEEDIPLLTGTLARAIDQRKGWSNLVIRWKHRDGTLRYLESSAVPIFDHAGNVLGFQGSGRDITERRKVEEMLRESEANYRQLFENSPAGIYRIDFKSGKFIKANDVFCAYAGCNQEEITSLSPFDILTEESQKLFLARLEKISQGVKVPEIVEFEILNKKGKRSILQLNIKNMYDSEGHIVGADVVAHDITERKKAEDKVHQSEEKYRNILEHMQEAYYEVDLIGNLIFCNDPLCRITGCSRDELLGVNFSVFSEPENSKKVFQLFNKVHRTGEPEDRFDWQVLRKDNTMKYVEASVSLMKDATGKKTGFRGLLRDISDRKLSEEKLQKTLDSLKKAVGTTIQVLVSVLESKDPYTAGHQTQVANLACVIATEMGLDLERIEGMRMAGVIHDIGKLAIPAQILTKPTKLTDIEFSLIKQHPQSGYEMLKYVESPWPLAQVVYQHHERMNGTGYPRNLKGDEILLEARIMAVADVVDAMASHRPYRASLGIEEALQEIEKNKGILYDETVVNTCLKLFREKDYKLA